MDIMLSISCLTYNHEKYISKTLDSMLEQKTDFPFEILIHDDASTDATQSIIESYTDRYPDIIKPILQTQNQYSLGIYRTNVYNFKVAKGKYIALCEGDDYWCNKSKLQTQVDYLEKHHEYSMCFHSAKKETVDGSHTSRLIRPYRKNTSLNAEEIIDKKSVFPTASLVFRREVIDNLPEFYYACPVGDLPLHLIAATYGKAYYMDSPMCVYRIGDEVSWTTSMMSGDKIAKQDKFFTEISASYMDFDKYTHGKYTSSIEHAIERVRFLTYMNTERYKLAFSKKYREYYKELDFRERFFSKLHYRLPALYRFLRYMAYMGR